MAEQLIDAAQSSLAKALMALSRRADRVHSQLSAAQRIRSAYLAAQVSMLLPTVSRAVMRTLQARLPAFMTSDVIAEFRRGLKLLAIFPRKQTRESLAILQYALTAYLSQIRYQELKEFDAEIAHLRSYLTDLQRAREQTSDLLRVLQVSQDCAAPVPPEAQPLLARIADACDQHRGRSHARPDSTRCAASAVHEQDTNLCAFMLAELPSRLAEFLTRNTPVNVDASTERLRSTGVPSLPATAHDAHGSLLETA
ncbi:hypothetical protein [Ralstonia solanacearum]|uniref:hypothetical protein n=1 Tax=Ralstonia solanacearum TaxID=305 RepID=UPI0005AC0B20|nr:hypothetical protein [Ralstonia solanacearum]MDC6180060.1 hypothetical protein [Ralstonia solanacearum]MDC6241448.1 hypothetical protein [Ralstonia solanacearum]